jgi:hypothetical protein
VLAAVEATGVATVVAATEGAVDAAVLGTVEGVVLDEQAVNTTQTIIRIRTILIAFFIIYFLLYI